MRRTGLITILMLAAVATGALAQKAVIQAEVITETATIVAIDSTSRLITLKNEAGRSETIYAGPEVQRFAALKVGDKVTFKYWESIVYAIQPPGAKPPEPRTAAIVRRPGTQPGATASEQLTTVVTIKAIDLKVPSVTVTTADGSVMSFKVEEPKNLEGVKAGDKVQVTYTRALAVSVESPKK
jgi:Cu/Ag efflux protein CusF